VVHAPEMAETTRRFFWRLIAVWLLAGSVSAIQAQVGNSSQDAQPNPPDKSSEGPSAGASTPADESVAARPPTSTEHDVIITTTPSADPLLPALPPDKFTNCMKESPKGIENKFDIIQGALCQHELNDEKRIVINACVNRDGKAAPARAVQACTELLDQRIFEGRERFFLFANRAKAYWVQGDKAHGLDDLNEAIELAPHNANLYYDRGLFYATQPDDEAALRDFDTAIGINAKLVPALQQRAKIHQIQNNLSGALSDYSAAIRLQPKSAALWSERGYVFLQTQDYRSAVSDETQAIRLDPNLARAFYLRGAAFGDLGNARDASNDIKAAVNLDPLLARYVVIQGKNASLTLPPL
jgi:tetratricopeptide (TPR) repeat protein